MASEIKLKRSGVSGIRPTTSDLSDGEIGVNTRDNIVFVANTTAVFEVGSILTTLDVTETITSANLYLSDSIKANGSFGTSNQVLTSNSTGGVSWRTPAGGGDVTKVATPLNDQIGVWTGDGTLEGTSAFTFNPSALTIKTANVEIFAVDGDANTVFILDATSANPRLALSNRLENDPFSNISEPSGGLQITTSRPTLVLKDYNHGADSRLTITHDGNSAGAGEINARGSNPTLALKTNDGVTSGMRFQLNHLNAYLDNGPFRVGSTVTATQALDVTGTIATSANLHVTNSIKAGGAFGTAGQVLTSNSTGGVSWTDDVEVYNHTWAVAGDVTAITLPPMFVLTGNSAGYEEVVTFEKFRAKIGGGTNASIKFQKNGVDIPSATRLVVPGAATESGFTANTMVDTDELGIVINSITGSPTDLSVTAYIKRRKVII
jgi:hypothetical protein